MSPLFTSEIRSRLAEVDAQMREELKDVVQRDLPKERIEQLLQELYREYGQTIKGLTLESYEH